MRAKIKRPKEDLIVHGICMPRALHARCQKIAVRLRKYGVSFNRSAICVQALEAKVDEFAALCDRWECKQGKGGASGP